MGTRDIIFELRNKAGLSHDELAEKVFVTVRLYPDGKMA